MRTSALVGHLSAHGHEYGHEVDLTASDTAQIAITDVTAGRYHSPRVKYSPGQDFRSATDPTCARRMPR